MTSNLPSHVYDAPGRCPAETIEIDLKRLVDQRAVACAAAVFARRLVVGFGIGSMRDELDTQTMRGEPAATAISSLAHQLDTAKAERMFFRAGRMAFRERQNEAACPYPGSSARAKLWLLGFADARSEERAKRERYFG